MGWVWRRKVYKVCKKKVKRERLFNRICTKCHPICLDPKWLTKNKPTGRVFNEHR